VTAVGRPPGPVGLRAKTKDRAKRPATRLATITATCQRTCTVATSRAASGVIAGVTITGTAKDGVVDTAGITWQYR
jgi:hypothetical protein